MHNIDQIKVPVPGIAIFKGWSHDIKLKDAKLLGVGHFHEIEKKIYNFPFLLTIYYYFTQTFFINCLKRVTNNIERRMQFCKEII